MASSPAAPLPTTNILVQRVLARGTPVAQCCLGARNPAHSAKIARTVRNHRHPLQWG